MTWTLRRKILSGYGLFLFLIVIVIAWAITDLLRLGRASDAILSENYQSILAAEHMINSIERQDSAILLVLLGFSQEGLNQFRNNESQFLQWLGRAKDNITIEGEGAILERIDRGYASYLVYFSQLRSTSTDTSREGTAFYHATVLPTFKAVRDSCDSLRELNSETMFNASARATRIARKATVSMGIFGALAVVTGFGFSLLLSSIIAKPLKSMMEATRELADGRYDVQVRTNSSDELGHLAQEFNAMTRKLKAYHELNIGEIVTQKRKKAAIIRSIDDGIIVIDADLKVSDINPAALRALATDSEQALNRHFLEIVKHQPLLDHVRQCMESGEPPVIQEGEDILSLRQAQTQRYFQFSITPVHVGADSMSAAVLVLRDVTRLKELDRLKTEFVMAASHELRTPLTSMGMSIDLLLENAGQKLDDKEQRLLRVAHEELERLKALVSNLLDLSKIEAGKMEMDLEFVAPQLLCSKAVAVMKPQADEKEIELALESAEGVPDVRADANKITWVLTNLISNALRYTEPGGYVHLLVEQVGPQVHFSVRDNGNLMVAQIAKKIFKVPQVMARVFDPKRAQVYRDFGIEGICPITVAGDVFLGSYAKPEKSFGRGELL